MRRQFGDEIHSGEAYLPPPNLYRPLPNATQLPWLITASNPVGANHRLIAYAFPTNQHASGGDRHRNLYGNRDNLPALKVIVGPGRRAGP